MDAVRYFKNVAKTHLTELRSGRDALVGLQQVQHKVAVEAGYRSWQALLTATESSRQLAAVMHREPQLNQFGFGPGAFAKTMQERRANFAQWRAELRTSAEHVDEIRAWLVLNIEPRQTINAAAGSYSLKHLAENDLGAYVANGELIAAAIIAGYSYRRDGGGSPNAFFGMSSRSTTPLRRRLMA